MKIFNNRAENTIALINTNAALIDTLRNQKDDINTAAAAAQAQAGTNLILGRAVERAAEPTSDTAGNPEAARLAECLEDPAVRQYPDPLRVCQEIVKQGQ